MGTNVSGGEFLVLSVGIGLLAMAYLTLRDTKSPRREDVSVADGLVATGVALPLALVLAVFGLALIAGRRLMDPAQWTTASF